MPKRIEYIQADDSLVCRLTYIPLRAIEYQCRQGHAGMHGNVDQNTQLDAHKLHKPLLSTRRPSNVTSVHTNLSDDICGSF